MRVIGLGAGGHAKVMLDIIQRMGSIKVDGLLDPDRSLWNTTVMGTKVLGDDGLLPLMVSEGLKKVFIGLGSTGDCIPRVRLWKYARGLGLDVIWVIDPSATISPGAHIGLGVTIMPQAIINADASLGDDVIVNTGAIVEHDCVLEDHVHVATGAKLASSVKVGAMSHVGAGATVLQCIKIGRGAIVGAGAVVTRDVADHAVVVGTPAREIKGESRLTCAI